MLSRSTTDQMSFSRWAWDSRHITSLLSDTSRAPRALLLHTGPKLCTYGLAWDLSQPRGDQYPTICYSYSNFDVTSIPLSCHVSIPDHLQPSECPTVDCYYRTHILHFRLGCRSLMTSQRPIPSLYATCIAIPT